MHESRTRQPAAKTPLLSTHRSVSPSGELSNGDRFPVRFLYPLLGIGSFPFLYLLLSMESLEHFGTPIALELRASFSARREASTPVYFSFFSLRFRFRFFFFPLMFVYQAKIIQDCFYHKPLKNSTTALTPPASNHYSIFADPPLINHTNYCPLFPPALGSAPFPFPFPFCLRSALYAR